MFGFLQPVQNSAREVTKHGWYFPRHLWLLQNRVWQKPPATEPRLAKHPWGGKHRPDFHLSSRNVKNIWKPWKKGIVDDQRCGWGRRPQSRKEGRSCLMQLANKRNAWFRSGSGFDLSSTSSDTGLSTILSSVHSVWQTGFKTMLSYAGPLGDKHCAHHCHRPPNIVHQLLCRRHCKVHWRPRGRIWEGNWALKFVKRPFSTPQMPTPRSDDLLTAWWSTETCSTSLPSSPQSP